MLVGKAISIFLLFGSRLRYIFTVPSQDFLVCVADMLQLKSTATVLEYHSVLRDQIL